MSIKWNELKEGKERTWGGFVEYARRYGVTVLRLPEVPFREDVVKGVDYLYRLDAGEALYYHMPENCIPDRRIGPFVFLQARVAAQDPTAQMGY